MATVPSPALSDRLSVSVAFDDTADPDELGSEHAVRFVYEVARRAGLSSWQEATATIGSVVGALGEWLEPSLRSELAEQLPDDLGQPMTTIAARRPRRDDVVALYRRAWNHEATNPSLHDVALRCAAVLAVIGEALPDPAVQRLVDALPSDIAALVAIPSRR